MINSLQHSSNMRASILIILCTVIISAHAACKILVRTHHSEKRYNFFPLQCKYLEFRVKAQHNLHILLASDAVFQAPYYEIVLGGWGGAKDLIRKDRDANIVVTKDQRTVDQRAFALYWVRIDDVTGTIQVGKGRGTLPVISYHDIDFEKVKYFGVATGFGSNGEWIIDTSNFDCQRSDKAPSLNIIPDD